MARLKKKDTDPVANIVQSISYGTGLICAKVTNLGKVTQTKEWKEVVSATQGVVKSAGTAMKNSITEMRESFDEGVDSIVKEENKFKTKSSASKKKEDDGIQDVEVIVKEENAEVKEQELAVKEEEVVPQEAKEDQVAPLPNELEPVGTTEDTHEELMDEEEHPKPKTSASKSNKKVAKVSFKAIEHLDNPSEFTVGEFKKDGKDPKGLMGSIKKNKPEISLMATDPLEWLNELLANGDNGQPLKYDIQETSEIKEAKEVFEGAEGEEKVQELIKLNRLILEQAYPLKCPKIQLGETHKKTVKAKIDKTKSKHSKSSDSGLNMN